MAEKHYVKRMHDHIERDEDGNEIERVVTLVCVCGYVRSSNGFGAAADRMTSHLATRKDR